MGSVSKRSTPGASVAIVSDLLRNPNFLTSFSDCLDQRLSTALKAQEGSWGDLFEQILSEELPPMESPQPPESTIGISRFDSHDPKDGSTRGKVGRNEACPCGSG